MVLMPPWLLRAHRQHSSEIQRLY